MRKKIFIHWYSGIVLLLTMALLFPTNPVAHPADPSPLLAQYALYGKDFLDFTEEATTQDRGWVGTGGYLRQGASWVHFNGIVKVTGDFNAGTNDRTWYKDTVYIKSTVSGDSTLVGKFLVRHATFPEPLLPDFPASSIKIDPNNTITGSGLIKLAPGSYGSINMGDDAAVVEVEAGEYHIDTLNIRGTLRVVKKASGGVTRLLVRSHVRFENAGGSGHKLVVADTSMLGRVLLYCTGTVRIDQGSRIDATLIAPNANIELKTEVVLNGQIHAQSLTFTNAFSGNDGIFIPFNPKTLKILDAAFPEDTTGLVDGIDRSYKAKIRFILSGNDSAASVQYRILKNALAIPAATWGVDFRCDTAGVTDTGTMRWAVKDSIPDRYPEVWIVDDNEIEPSEWFSITLFNPVNIAFSNDSAQITYSLKILSEDSVIGTGFRRGAVYGSSGSGLADHAICFLTSGSNTAKTVARVMYRWPSTAAEDTCTAQEITLLSDVSFSFAIDTARFRSGSGTGIAMVLFKDGSSVQGSLADSCGPAIVLASCNQTAGNRTYDTLEISTTESISLSNLGSGSMPLVLYADSVTVKGDTILVKSLFPAGARYRFCLPKGTIKRGNWVRFNAQAGESVHDLVGNLPLPINRKVPILVMGGQDPVSVTGAVFDVWGSTGRIDGHSDSLFIVMSLSSDPEHFTVDSLTRLYLQASSGNVLLHWTRLSDSTLYVFDSSLKGVTGSATVLLHFGSSIVPGTLADSVAPVIQSAEYHNWSDRMDSLIITFTEPLKNSGNARPFLFEIAPPLTVAPITISGATVRYAVLSGEVATRDSIWIKAGTQIIDLAGKEQTNSNNRKVALAYQRVVSVARASYHDLTPRADGYIDEVQLKFGLAIPASAAGQFGAILSLPSDRGLLVTGDEKVVGNTVYIGTAHNPSKVPVPVTSVSATDVVSFTKDIAVDTFLLVARTPVPVEDSLAPVITDAEYSMMVTQTDGVRIIDTLSITYSEPVNKLTCKNPFTLRRKSNASLYTITLGLFGETGQTPAYTVPDPPDSLLPSAGDSIWIDKAGEVADQNGLLQRRNTVGVVLRVKPYKPNFEVLVYPNPYPIDNTSYVNMAILKNGGTNYLNHIALCVRPIGRSLIGDIQCTLKIYDQVGNKVNTPDCSNPLKGSAGQYLYPFQPVNTNERLVGTGPLLGVVRIDVNGVFAARKRVMIGICETPEQ